MKIAAAALALLAASTNAFSSSAPPDTPVPPFASEVVDADAAVGAGVSAVDEAPTVPAYSLGSIPGALDPTGLFDPLGFGAKAGPDTLKRYREAELTHGRVAMLATVGFLAGEKVEGSSFLFDASVQGPAITHLAQVPAPFWTVLVVCIAKLELDRARLGWVNPKDVPVDQPGLLREDYTPGDLGFDPFKLTPKDPGAFLDMQNKELQNGRLAMIAAVGFMAQELVDGKAILEHLSS
jgi:Chlorophyll A-B binding protein